MLFEHYKTISISSSFSEAFLLYFELWLSEDTIFYEIKRYLMSFSNENLFPEKIEWRKKEKFEIFWGVLCLIIHFEWNFLWNEEFGRKFVEFELNWTLAALYLRFFVKIHFKIVSKIQKTSQLHQKLMKYAIFKAIFSSQVSFLNKSPFHDIKSLTKKNLIIK